jgi:hypothetical protein
MRKGIQIGAVELLDDNAIRAVNQYVGLQLQEAPTIFFKSPHDTATVLCTPLFCTLCVTHRCVCCCVLGFNARSTDDGLNLHRWHPLIASWTSLCPCQFVGSEVGVKDEVSQVEALIGDYNGGQFDWATDKAKRDQIWEGRQRIQRSTPSVIHQPSAHIGSHSTRPVSALWPVLRC